MLIPPVKDAPPKIQGLFDRVPQRIFGPLAAPSRERYWSLLLRLNDRCFGPDAPGGMEEGLLHGRVTREIEIALDEDGLWSDSEEESPELTPLNIRANMILSRLVEAGWLAESKLGARQVVTMRPTVQKFLEMLKKFGDEGPMFVAGKVQLIYNTLEQIEKNPARQAFAFEEASEQAQSLISMLNGTAARVREIMDVLAHSEATPEFVEGFFAEYVSTLFLKDYASLRTENHPLRYRHDIVRIARTLRDEPERREQMLVWYRSFHSRRAINDVEAIYEKHIARFLRFEEVERYLDRLDDAVSAATRKALSYLHYRLRSQGKIDRLVGLAIESVLEAERESAPLPYTFGCRPLFSELALRPARVPKVKPKSLPIVRPKMTDEQRAEAMLRSAMSKARRVTDVEIKRYLRKASLKGQTIQSDQLPLNSVPDFVSFLALARAAFLSRKVPKEKRSVIPLFNGLAGIEATSLDEQMENELLYARKFQVTRLKED